MSLLLDALRRAAASKQGPESDQYTVPRRPEGAPEAQTGEPAGRSAADDAAELTLEPELPAAPAGDRTGENSAEGAQDDQAVAPATRQGADHAGSVDGAAGTQSPGRAAAGTLLAAGGSRSRRGYGHSALKGLLVLLIAGVALGAIAVAGWWYYLESQRATRADLAAYQPTADPLVDNGPVIPAATQAGDADAGGSGQPSTAANVEAANEPDSATDGATAEVGSEPPGVTTSTDRDEATETATADDAVATDATAASATTADSSGASPSAADGGNGAASQTDGSGIAAATTDSEPATTDSEPAGTEAAQPATQSAGQPARRAEPLVQRAGPSELDRKLQTGYEALRSGDLEGAAVAYGRALRLAPENRDALLGAASVAQRRGDLARATELYARVLRDYPGDPYARASLAALLGGRDPRRAESELKSLLREQPGSASLYYALGTVYARESRWSDAQSAFFEAHRNEPDNPDYAYNLAVALDHLGKRDAARSYYGKALAVSGGRATSFPLGAARRRLEQLQ